MDQPLDSDSERRLSWLLLGLCLLCGLLLGALEQPAAPLPAQAIVLGSGAADARVRALQLLLQSHPAESELHEELARRYAELGQPERAQAHLGRARRLRGQP
jgi:predicted Zn-dependent protease